MLGKEKSLEEQLKEHKEKEKKLLLRIEEDRKAAKEQRELEEKLAKEKKELEAKIAKEKELLENEKKLKEQLDRETKIAKDKEIEQQKYANEQAKKEKELTIKKEKEEKLKDHPDGCFCPECKELRTMNINGKDVEIAEEYPSVEASIEATTAPKKSKFKFNFKKSSKPKMSPEEGKTLFKEYDESKKNPNKILSFINTQKQKIKDKNKPKPINQEGAIDTRVTPSVYTDITVLGIRLAIGFSFIAHGLSKMSEEMVAFLPMLELWGVPSELAFPIALAELVAGILITMGILTRISSGLIGVIMLGAIFVVKGTGALIGQGGIELDLIVLASVALLGMFGPGRLSIANIGIKGMIFDRKLQ